MHWREGLRIRSSLPSSVPIYNFKKKSFLREKPKKKMIYSDQIIFVSYLNSLKVQPNKFHFFLNVLVS